VEVRSVHHVAFAVEDLDAAVGTYQRLFGARIELRGRMDDQGVEAAYLRIGDGRIELVSALGEDTGVGPACTTSLSRWPTSLRPSGRSPLQVSR
jgi:catechol 2,3-dioxygenase-like lactoylglutathione lyase family enzyme